MTNDEWSTVSMLLDECWKGEFTREKEIAYKAFLLRHDVDLVMAALERIVQNGDPWLPTVPEIAKAINQLTVPPSPAWTDVWAAMQVAMKSPTAEEAVELMAQRVGAVAAHFYSLERHDQLRMTRFFCPDWGFKRVEELQSRWAEFAEHMEDRARAGRAIDATRLRRGIGQPTQLRAVDTLGLTPPPELALSTATSTAEETQ